MRQVSLIDGAFERQAGDGCPMPTAWRRRYLPEYHLTIGLFVTAVWRAAVFCKAPTVNDGV